MCSSSGCGEASNTRRCICEPMKPSARLDIRSVDISTFTMAAVHILGATPDQAYFDLPPLRAAAYPRQRLHLSTRNFCSDNRDQFRSKLTTTAVSACASMPRKACAADDSWQQPVGLVFAVSTHETN